MGLCFNDLQSSLPASGARVLGAFGLCAAYSRQLGEVSGVKFAKKDSAKTTLVTISLNGEFWLGKMSLDIHAPKFYNRNVAIYDCGGHRHELLATVALRSGDGGELLINIKTNKLVLEIENEDNPPLSLDKVKLFQSERSALAYLQSGRTYRLLTGDASAAAPDYDLKFFADSAKNRALKITHKPVEKNALYVALTSATKPGNQKTFIIWGAALAALLLLSLLTWKMADEVKKRA